MITSGTASCRWFFTKLLSLWSAHFLGFLILLALLLPLLLVPGLSDQHQASHIAFQQPLHPAGVTLSRLVSRYHLVCPSTACPRGLDRKRGPGRRHGIFAVSISNSVDDKARKPSTTSATTTTTTTTSISNISSYERRIRPKKMLHSLLVKTGIRHRPLVVGIIGGIASGKTTVTKELEKHGAAIIDADKLGHEAYTPGTRCFERLVEEFGTGIVNEEDGTINRRALGGLIFGQPANKEKLERIVWPEIRTLAEESIAQLSKPPPQGDPPVPCIVLEAAVMLEAGWVDMVDELWVVGTEASVAKERLMKRNSWSAEEADKRINSQMSNEERFAAADVVVRNDGDEAELRTQVARLWEQRGSFGKHVRGGEKGAVLQRRRVLLAVLVAAAVVGAATALTKGVVRFPSTPPRGR